MRTLLVAALFIVAVSVLSAAALSTCGGTTTTTTTTTTSTTALGQVSACPQAWDAQVIADVNRARGQLPPVSPNAKVNQAADARATQLAMQGHYDDHTPWVEQALRAAGYVYSYWRENIYVGPTVDQVVAGWMSSGPHRDNILATNVSDVGVGCVFDAHGARWWSLILGKGA